MANTPRDRLATRPEPRAARDACLGCRLGLGSLEGCSALFDRGGGGIWHLQTRVTVPIPENVFSLCTTGVKYIAPGLPPSPRGIRVGDSEPVVGVSYAWPSVTSSNLPEL